INASTLIGTSVTSSGYAGFASGPMLISPAIEFSDGGLFSADFGSNGLSFKFTPPDCSQIPCENVSLNSFSVSFTDAAFQGASVSLTSDTFPLIAWSLIGKVLTLSVPSTGIPSPPHEALFSISPVPVPPGLALFGTGLGLIGLLGWR